MRKTESAHWWPFGRQLEMPIGGPSKEVPADVPSRFVVYFNLQQQLLNEIGRAGGGAACVLVCLLARLPKP